MSTDLVSNMISALRNAYKAQLPKVTLPYSRLSEDVAKVLEGEGYLVAHRVEANGNKRDLVLELKYIDGEPALKEIKRVSKSGLRKYVKRKAMPKHYNGLGISILTTSKGVMSDFTARQQQVGGEVLCTVF